MECLRIARIITTQHRPIPLRTRIPRVFAQSRGWKISSIRKDYDLSHPSSSRPLLLFGTKKRNGPFATTIFEHQPHHGGENPLKLLGMALSTVPPVPGSFGFSPTLMMQLWQYVVCGWNWQQSLVPAAPLLTQLPRDRRLGNGRILLLLGRK